MPPTKPCAHCGQTMPYPDSPRSKSNWSRKKYCSKACKKRADRAKHPSTPEQQARDNMRRRARRTKKRRPMSEYPPRVCEQCGTTYYCENTRSAKAMWARRKFCARQCNKKANEGTSDYQKRLAREERAHQARIERETVLVTEGASLFVRLGEPLGSTLRESFRVHPDFARILANPSSDMVSLAYPVAMRFTESTHDR